MRGVRRIMQGAACVVCLVAQLSMAGTQGPQPLATPRGRLPPDQMHALVVGVSRSPGLPDLPALHGVAADVWAMKSLALALGVAPGNLRVLADTEPGATAPTLPNIDGALKVLEGTLTSGQHLLVYLGGHGAQQPVLFDASESGPEFDGLDEVFLAADAQRFDPTSRSMPGVLTDNRLGRFLQALAVKGVHVWLVVDSCHAGTMSRGSLDGTDEFLPVAWRGASLEQIGLDRARLRWRSLVGQGAQVARTGLRALSAGKAPTQSLPAQFPRVTAFYATDEGGLAMEVRRKNPSSGANAAAGQAPSSATTPVRGLFTFILVDEAQRLLATPGAGAVVNYRVLMQRVQARYRARAPRDAPRPVFEGVDGNTWFGRTVTPRSP